MIDDIGSNSKDEIQFDHRVEYKNCLRGNETIEQLIPKIVANSSNRYVAVYLRGGFKYNFLDYNYQYQETNSVEYYYSDELKDPYKKVTTSYTSGGVTYEPIDLTNSIPSGMYFATNTNINLDNSSTPLNLS